jgi:hypothetical protein
MKKVAGLARFVFPLILVLFVGQGCSKHEDDKWTKKDHEVSNHYYASQRDNKEASRIARQAGNRFSKEQIAQIRALTASALAECRLVTDEFLDKVHPKFKSHFRDEFQVALELALQNLEAPDYQTAKKSSELFSNYADWFAANQEEIHFPH